jgi:hypothetical protein
VADWLRHRPAVQEDGPDTGSGVGAIALQWFRRGFVAQARGEMHSEAHLSESALNSAEANPARFAVRADSVLGFYDEDAVENGS